MGSSWTAREGAANGSFTGVHLSNQKNSEVQETERKEFGTGWGRRQKSGV